VPRRLPDSIAEPPTAPRAEPIAGPLVLPGRFRAAVFDLDGLLLDTEPLWQDAERELLERHGEPLTDADREASHGRAVAESAAAYAPRLGLSVEAIEAELLEIMLVRYVAGPPLLEGVRELIDALDGRIALAIASNTTAPLVRRALESVGLDAFSVIV
jgi:mannitol-1-/sugar-/sorbitol-6-/2-deoxyglucose-6-phosphatase